MKLSAKEVKGVIVITLSGNVMGGPDATALNGELHKLAEKKKKKIVLDISDVQTMNSSGLGMLSGALTAVKNAGGVLKIAGASDKIESLLVITRLTSMFELFPDTQTAVGSFS